MSTLCSEGPAPRSPIRHKNDFRWRVMPCDEAAAAGYYDRSFGNKKAAVAYQKEVKAKFPHQPCALCDTGRYFDAEGRSYSTRV